MINKEKQRNPNTSGFTLIELMIVVAIIAIIAAIAIPNLLESRIQANETAAVSVLKQYANAQEIYRKANYSEANGLSPKGFCPSHAFLGGTTAHQNQAGTALELLPLSVADATIGSGYQGYYFTNDANVTNWQYTYGLYADPCLYEKSGVNTYWIGAQGTVHMQDLAGVGSGGTVNTNGWTIP